MAGDEAVTVRLAYFSAYHSPSDLILNTHSANQSKSKSRANMSPPTSTNQQQQQLSSPNQSPNPNNTPQPIRRKLVIIGDGACGKTSLLSVFAMGEFPEDYEPTIFENYVAEIRLDNKPIQLALWDTAGQEEYERLRPLSYSKSHVILIAFAIDTPDSLENVTVKWIEEVRSICGPTIPVILVGCKKDLRDADNGSNPSLFVSKSEAEQVAQSINARCYMECSALKNEGVDSIFESATRAAMLVRQPNSNSPGGNPHSSSTGNNHDEKKSGNNRNHNKKRKSNKKSGDNSTCCSIV
ncbi:hypothetical protein PSHT_00043 [Puccinia striiformis]|uniref:Rho family, other n=3 Tax=Puccinia striiformis TaxID=27350 RepID=A0A2S4WNS1_9BASI|nr:hypothetical protein PSHT_00043 [Puccinia striiformis]